MKTGKHLIIQTSCIISNNIMFCNRNGEMIFEHINLARDFLHVNSVLKFYLPNGFLEMREHPPIQHVEVWRVRWLRDKCNVVGFHKLQRYPRHMATSNVQLGMDL